jgi:molybdopterin converting factor small subunit
MIITVTTYAGLMPSSLGEGSRFSRELEVSFDDPTVTVVDLLARLGVAPGEVGVIVVNDYHADADFALSDGDRVALFPLFAGG